MSEARRRIAVFGGSFNPPHVGHAMVASWLRWTDQVDEVWLLPAFQHAFGKALWSFELRVALCEALVADLPGPLRVETIEARLPVPSYTIETLDALARAHPDARLRLVVGADTLASAGNWRRWDRIAAEYDPIVVGRAGYASPDGAVVFPEVSSTEVRRRLQGGERVDHLLPARVLRALQGAGGPPPSTP